MMTDRRFGPDQTLCHLCTQCIAADVGNGLCAEWLKARSMNVSSEWVWHFAEYSPGRFALYGPNREVALLTSNWDEVLEHYRSRPPYIPPPTPILTRQKQGLADVRARINL